VTEPGLNYPAPRAGWRGVVLITQGFRQIPDAFRGLSVRQVRDGDNRTKPCASSMTSTLRIGLHL